MFNVTIFRLKDIIKYFSGIIITMLVVIFLSKYFYKDTKKEENIVKGIKTELSILSEKSLVESLDKVIPSISNVNEEYKNISKEDDNTEEKSILEAMLETQISSIKGIENIEEKVK